MAQDTAMREQCPSSRRAERRARRRPRAFRIALLVFTATALLAAFIVRQMDQYRMRNLRDRSALIADDYAGKFTTRSFRGSIPCRC